ncbi:MAG: hypothetical protein CMB68_04980 [Euryarchaeota archaeon]|nr:hypothetical protein [Euryarchaeota archaeon]|tara:strand:+ start:2539 stop:3153 length:615 start_codon:yes stop_codon:yes gene_type:complete
MSISSRYIGELLKNLGHRLGGSGTPLENTIQSLKDSIENTIFNLRNFRYWEFDIHESSDSEIFVFHDDEIHIDGKSHILNHLTLVQIQELGRTLGISIPTLSEVLEILNERPEKVMIEVKSLLTEEGREKVVENVRRNQNFTLMASPARFEKSFPKNSREYWHERLRKSNTKLVRVRRHRVDLFNASKSKLLWLLSKPKWLFFL